MRMTALDVRNHVFPRSWKGYDVNEVEHFRSALVEDWAALTQENEGLRKRVAELEARLADLTIHENKLRDALVTAQGMSDDLRRTSEHEAQMRVGQAELQAEKILCAAHREAARLAQDVRELRALRSRMAGSVRATIETHLALLEGFTRDLDDEAEEPCEAPLGRLGALASPPPGPDADAEASEAEEATAAARGAGASAFASAEPPAGRTQERTQGRSSSGWTVLVDRG